jgi:hypothetical protein
LAFIVVTFLRRDETWTELAITAIRKHDDTPSAAGFKKRGHPIDHYPHPGPKPPHDACIAAKLRQAGGRAFTLPGKFVG